MKAFIENLDSKLRDFGVDERFFGEMRALVEKGTRPCAELRKLLRGKYKACFGSLLLELSKPVIQQHFCGVRQRSAA
jgi:hypothetical protein